MLHQSTSSKKVTLLSGLLGQAGIQPFLDNPKYTEIAINRPYELWTESSEGWDFHPMPDLDFAKLQQIANAFFISNKRVMKQGEPICSGVFDDGQRGQIVVPSAVERNTIAITVRRPSDTRFAIRDYLDSGRLGRWVDVSTFKTTNSVMPDFYKAKADAEQQRIGELEKELGIPTGVHLKLYELEMLYAKATRDIEKFIHLAVEHRQNIVLVGATGSGKTTFTKSICDLVPHDTRIITIEDTAELSLPYHRNRVHMFYGEVAPKDLVHSCMRMKPDRIFLTELRGDEAFNYLVALNTGHAGSVTTVHANDCLSAYYRVGDLIKQSEVGQKIDFDHIMSKVFTTLDVVMFLDRTYVTEVSYDPVRKYLLQQGSSSNIDKAFKVQ